MANSLSKEPKILLKDVKKVRPGRWVRSWWTTGVEDGLVIENDQHRLNVFFPGDRVRRYVEFDQVVKLGPCLGDVPRF